MFSHPNIGFMKASIQTSPKRTKHEVRLTIVDCDMIVREEVIGCEEEKQSQSSKAAILAESGFNVVATHDETKARKLRKGLYSLDPIASLLFERPR